MSDGEVIGLLMLGAAACGALTGGLVAIAIAWVARRIPHLLVTGLDDTYELKVDVRAAPVGAITVPVAVRTPEPITFEVQTTGAPSTREQAARIIAVFPTIGPSELSRAVGCSKSTAHAIIQEVRAGHIALPAPTEE